jgi:hypothetical protein
MRIMTLTCVALLAASTLYAQDEPARKAATEVAARVPLEKALKGAPYSAETVVEGTQQLADGNRIARKTTGRVYRDSDGRTRREEDRANGTMSISITDPMGGFSYSLDAQNKIAWRTPMGAAGIIMGKVEASQAGEKRKLEGVLKIEVENEAAAARAGGSDDVKTVTGVVGGRGGAGGSFARVAPGGVPSVGPVTAGPLEHKTMEGVAVEGRKMTTVLPAGQVGNEQPITITSEQWSSPELSILVMTRHSDPRTGDSTYRVQNIIRAEPDRSLFMVPADYTVKDTGIRKMLEASRK